MSSQRKRGRRHPLGRAGVLAAIALPFFALSTAAGMGGGDPAGAARAEASRPEPTWTAYFYPLKVGWTCHESLSSSLADASETLTVSSVGAVPGGRSVTLDVGSSATAAGVAVPANAALHYVLTDQGRLISVPSGAQVAGQAYQIEGDTTYLSVQGLLSGNTSVAHLHVDAPLSEADIAELSAVLPHGATSLDMSVALRQSGTSVALVRTPMGTFHDVLEVRGVMTSLDFTNLAHGASKELLTALKPLLGKELDTTTWYARGVGPIKVDSLGFTAFMTSCGQS